MITFIIEALFGNAALTDEGKVHIIKFGYIWTIMIWFFILFYIISIIDIAYRYATVSDDSFIYNHVNRLVNNREVLLYVNVSLFGVVTSTLTNLTVIIAIALFNLFTLVISAKVGQTASLFITLIFFVLLWLRAVREANLRRLEIEDKLSGE